MTSAGQDKALPSRAVLLGALLTANAALALGPWLVRLADTGPVASGFWRLALPIPLFAWLAFRESKIERPPRKMVLLVIAAGIFFALDIASWHIGIELTRLGNATIFGNSGGLLLMLWGLIALRRIPQTNEWVAVGAAVLGAAILMGRSLEISASTLGGDLFCLLGGLFYACYLIPAQRARATLGPWSVLALVCLAGAPVLLAISLLLGEMIVPIDWTPVLVLALSSQIVGQGLLVFSLRHFSPLVIGLALLTQPVLAALTGWLAFDEVLGAMDVGGMVLLGAALVLAHASSGRRHSMQAKPG